MIDLWIKILLSVVGFIYIFVGMLYVFKGNIGLAITFWAYSVGVLGLYLAGNMV